ncbi:MAG: CBS domain-containing protein [Chloroflexota bacterium]|nr:CBS domain-containing protein [Chloroflexota bacterium]
MLATVRDLLSVKGDKVWSVSPETTVIDALQLLADKQVGALLVLDGDQIAGIVSERDFVRRIAADQSCHLGQPVREIMTQDVFTIHPDDDLDACMQWMTEKHIRHLPVVEQGELVGLVSIGDVVKAIIVSHEFTIEQLSKFIDGGGYNT